MYTKEKQHVLNIKQGINFRLLLVKHIVRLVTGADTVTGSGNEYSFDGTEEQESEVQDMINEHLPRFEYIIQQLILRYSIDNGIYTPEIFMGQVA